MSHWLWPQHRVKWTAEKNPFLSGAHSLPLAVTLPLVNLLLCSFLCTFGPSCHFFSAATPPVHPSSHLFFHHSSRHASQIYFLISSIHPINWSILWLSAHPLSLVLALPLSFGVLPPLWAQHSDRRFIKVSQRRSVCPLLHNCPGKGANRSTYRSWSAIPTRS